MKTDYAYSSRSNQYNGNLVLRNAEDSAGTSIMTRTHILK